MKLSLRRFLLQPGLLAVLLLAAATSLIHLTAGAQQSGHYLQGITGLENGSGTPPGFYASYLPYVYPIRQLKGANGDTLLNVDLNLVANNAVFSSTLDKKFLGADYGFSVIIPVVNTRVTADAIGASTQQAGLSDIYVAPIVLGWTKGKANFLVNYGFYVPSGQFDPSAALNSGLGFWEQQIQAGTTYSFDQHKLWNASMLTTWEMNQSKTGLDLKPGPMFTGEYSLGRRFFKYQMNAGAAGYIYKKLSPDSGSDVKPFAVGVTDRSFGIGPEWKYTNVKWRTGFDFRYERQFGVQAKTSGNVFVMSITFLSFLPPKKK